MTAEQGNWGRIIERLESTAIIQERILARLDGLEKWRDDRDRERERLEERRDERIDKAPDQQRANLAIIISAIMAAFYLLTYVSQHWKP